MFDTYTPIHALLYRYTSLYTIIISILDVKERLLTFAKVAKQKSVQHPLNSELKIIICTRRYAAIYIAICVQHNHNNYIVTIIQPQICCLEVFSAG